MLIYDMCHAFGWSNSIDSNQLHLERRQATVEASATRLRGGDGHGPESPEACIKNKSSDQQLRAVVETLIQY